MDADLLAQLLERVRQGRVSVKRALDRLRHLPFEDLGFAKVDHHRSLRQGFPEVIMGQGKSAAEQAQEIYGASRWMNQLPSVPSGVLMLGCFSRRPLRNSPNI